MVGFLAVVLLVVAFFAVVLLAVGFFAAGFFATGFFTVVFFCTGFTGAFVFTLSAFAGLGGAAFTAERSTVPPRESTFRPYFVGSFPTRAVAMSFGT